MNRKRISSICKLLILVGLFVAIRLVYQFANYEKYDKTETASHVEREDVVGRRQVMVPPGRDSMHAGWEKMRLTLQENGEFSLTGITQDIRNNAVSAPLDAGIETIDGTWELHSFKHTVNMKETDRSSITLTPTCGESRSILFLLTDSRQEYRINWHYNGRFEAPCDPGIVWGKAL